MANLLVVIWYSRNLPQDVYGHYQNFWVQLNVIYPIACFGIHVLAITYSPGFIKALLRRINAGQYALYALWMITLSAVFAWLQCSALNSSFIVPFLFILCFALSVILESLLIVFRNYGSLTIINILYSAAYWLIHFYVLKQGFSLQSLFTCLLIVTALRTCIYSGIVVGNLKQSTKEVQPEVVDAARIRHLWLHLGLYDVLQILFSWIDKFIISLVLTASVSAVYYNGSQTIPFLPLLLSAAGSAVLMQLATRGKQDEEKSMIQLMNQSGRVLSCIVFPVFFFLFFYRQQLFALLGDKYVTAVPVFAMAVLVLPVKAYSFTTVLQRMHKGSIINAGAIADLVLACTLMYPLYKLMDLPGVALSFVITTYLQAAFYLVYSARLLRASPLELVPYMNWLIKLIVFATVFISIRYAGGLYFTGEISLILGGVVMIILVAVSLSLEFIRHRKHGSQ